MGKKVEKSRIVAIGKICYDRHRKQPCYKVVSLPNLQKKGGGVNGDVHFSGPDPVCDVFNCTACLHR